MRAVSRHSTNRIQSRRSITLAVIAAIALPLSAITSATASPAVRTGGPTATPAANPLPPSGATLSGSPGVPLADPADHTLYVPIQCRQDFCSDGKPSNVLDLIDTRHCRPTTRCHVVARARVGASPLAAALDAARHTLYVANAGGTDPGAKGSGSVTVIDTHRCNASVTRGCRHPVATIRTGGFLVAAALDRARATLYLANLKGSVFVVDVRRCTATDQRSCSHRVHNVPDKAGPSGIAVDRADATVYASNVGLDGAGHTVSLINAARCNGHRVTGCKRVPHEVSVGGQPYWDTVDQKTHTVYTANGAEDTVSIINAATCNATVRTGCRKVAKSVRVGASPQFVDVDQKLHTVFALASNDDTLAVLDSRTCRAGTLKKCPAVAKSRQVAPNQGRHYVSFPNAFALLASTATLYSVGVGGRSALAVADVSRCNAVTQRGCRQTPPQVHATAGQLTADESTHTLYAANVDHHRIDVYDTAACNVSARSRCAPVGRIRVPYPGVALSDVNDATHTLYAADGVTGAFLVIDTSACRAGATAGCGSAVKATQHVGDNASALAENAATHALYVVYGPFDSDPNLVAVLSTLTCRAANVSGCGHSPAIVPVGSGANGLAVSVATNSVYVANSGAPSLGHTVSVINGATCNGSVHLGCASPVATAEVGLEPFDVAVDDATHTVYVVDNANGDSPGNVTVIDSATCNGSSTVGCAGHHPRAGIGRSGLLAAIDTVTHLVYVSDYSSAAVSVIDGKACAATKTGGCTREAPLRAVPSNPFGIAVDHGVHTVYVATFSGALAMLRTA